MTIERYRALIEHLYATLGVDTAPALAQAAHLMVDGTEFHLFHGGLLEPDSVIMHCIFGTLPERRREEVLLRLLETQTHLFGVCSPVFSHDASSNRITLMCRFPLKDEEQVLATLELLQFFSSMAKRWGEDHFRR